MDPLQKASGRGWVDERKGRLLGGKTVVTPSNQPEASFQGGRRIGVSRDDGRRGARVRVSCWEAASAGLCVCVCVQVRIGCLGQSGSFLVVCVSVGEYPCLCAHEHLRGPRTCRLCGGLSGYVPLWV